METICPCLKYIVPIFIKVEEYRSFIAWNFRYNCTNRTLCKNIRGKNNIKVVFLFMS